jgi:nucleotide-binding universal stress UspA family protein
MVYVDAESVSRERVRLAAGLADKFNATLIGVSALAVRPPIIADGAVVTVVTEADILEIETRLADRAKFFRVTAGVARPKLEWRQFVDFPNDTLACEARSADLVVIGPTRGSADTYSSLNAGNAILGLGRPTLVVPDGVSSLRAEHVVIGWKDTREARRAVQDSLPLLHEASRVTIVEICEAGQEALAQAHIDNVAQYLTRHRIKGGPKVILHRDGSGAMQLLQHAQDESADLLVIGAYGHSRLGEWIFGGMTRDILTNCPICCLMSH